VVTWANQNARTAFMRNHRYATAGIAMTMTTANIKPKAR
jgi:hypothetical protein